MCIRDRSSSFTFLISISSLPYFPSGSSDLSLARISLAPASSSIPCGLSATYKVTPVSYTHLLEDDPDNTQSQDEQNTDADASESLEENNPDNTQEEDNASSDGNSSEESYQQLAEDFAKEKEEYYLLLANPDNPLPEDWTVETEEVQGGFVMDSRVAAVSYTHLDVYKRQVKILREEYMDNDEFMRRFRNESRAISLLDHPNIVKVYDVIFSNRIQSIVMEYIDGITLKDYIDQELSLIHIWLK